MLIALVPVFNEESNIIRFLDRLVSQTDYIVIINDGSGDRTGELISGWMRDRKNIKYIFFKKNRGMAKALLQGFGFIKTEYESGKFNCQDILVTIDADGQHNPSTIKEMQVYFTGKNCEVLIAKRNLENYPLYRVIGNKLISFLNSLVGRFKFEDIESGFKMMKIGFIPDLLNYYTGYRYSCASEIAIIASLLKYKVDNSYSIMVPYYRKRTRRPGIIDFFINIVFSFLVSVKISFGKKRLSPKVYL